MRRKDGVQGHIGDAHHEHDHEPMADLPFGCDAPCQASAQPGAPHDSRNRQNEEPEKLGGFEFQMFAQKCWGRQHIQEHAVERYPTGQCQQEELGAGAQRPIPAHQVPHVEGLAVAWVQGFGQQPEIGDPQNGPHQCQEPENTVPAGVHKKPPAYDGCHGRCHPEVDGDLAHHLLGLRWREHVADHSA